MKRTKENPASPWLWREDWAEGRIHFSESGKVLYPFVLGLALICVSLALYWYFSDTIQSSSKAALAIIAAVPVFGAIAILVGIVRLLRLRKYGRSTLALVANPGVIGGWLRVELHSKLQPSPSEKVTAKLKCMHRSKRELGSAGEDISMKWSSEQVLESALFTLNHDRTSTTSINFHIPYDCTETSQSQAGFYAGQPNGHYWMLEVKGNVHGTDYCAEFMVPVFKTVDSAREIEPAEY